MINKIIVSIIFACLIFAISLSLLGVDGPITLGPAFRSFMQTCSIELNQYKISIPDIPRIPFVEDVSQVGGVEFLFYFVNGLVTFINGLTTLINFVILLVNTIIQLLEFIFIVIRRFITMRDSIVGQNG